MALSPLQIKTRASTKDLKAGKIEGSGQNFKGSTVDILVHDLEPSWTDIQKKEGGAARVAAEYYDGNTWVAMLQDVLFDGLAPKDRAWWHTALADAVASRKRPWSEVLHTVHIALLGVALRAAPSKLLKDVFVEDVIVDGEMTGDIITGDVTLSVVQDVIDLHTRALTKSTPPIEEWRRARRAANNAWRNPRKSTPEERAAYRAAAESAAWQLSGRPDANPQAWAVAWYTSRAIRWQTDDERELVKANLELAQAVISEMERTP